MADLIFRPKLLRTAGSGPPAEMYWGDWAYSDADQSLHIARPDNSVLSFPLIPPTGYAPANHNHDGVYAPANHDHAGTYAPANHDHAGTYAPASHDHAGTYAPASHSHDGIPLASFVFDGNLATFGVKSKRDPGGILAPAMTRTAQGRYEIAIAGLTTAARLTHAWGNADNLLRVVSLVPSAGLLSIAVRNVSNSFVDLDYCSIAVESL